MPSTKEEGASTLDDAVVQAYIRENAGDFGLQVARLIEEKQPASGVDVMEALAPAKPSEVRKILYRLEDARVAEYQKDTDKSGWETFMWRLTLSDAHHKIARERSELRRRLQQQLDIERENSFYQCDLAHTRLIFDDAVPVQFKCPECNRDLNFVQNEVRIDEITQAISDIDGAVG